jgi:hypothetical protein
MFVFIDSCIILHNPLIDSSGDDVVPEDWLDEEDEDDKARRRRR